MAARYSASRPSSRCFRKSMSASRSRSTARTAKSCVGLMYELLDHYLGVPANEWPEKFIAFKKEKIARACRVRARRPQNRRRSVRRCRWRATSAPTLILVRQHRCVAGQGQAGDRLQVDTDAWVARSITGSTTVSSRVSPTRTIEPAYVNFGLDADGKVERITMKPVSPLADFSYDYKDLLFTPLENSK